MSRAVGKRTKKDTSTQQDENIYSLDYEYQGIKYKLENDQMKLNNITNSLIETSKKYNSKDALFECLYFDEYKNTHNKIIKNLQNKEKIESAGKCRFCGSEETMIMKKQTRSSDEPVSIFKICLSCNKQQRIS